MSTTIRSVFQLIPLEREDAIAEHRFYVEQAKSRLLTAFNNISEEANRAEEVYWEESGRHFDPNYHDEGMLAEAARDHGITYYELLSEMRERTRLSIISGMYHHWDKRFRRFLVREMRWPGLIPGEHTRRAVWKIDSAKLEDFLRALGLDVRAFPCFSRMEAMRLVVNVSKHGEGKSLDDLQQLYPEFVPRNSSFTVMHPDDTDMAVTDEHLCEFADAIEAFWRALPAEHVFDFSQDFNLPKEIDQARRKDLAAIT